MRLVLFIPVLGLAISCGVEQGALDEELALNRVAEPFQLASSGCPMAHCDPRMSDDVRQGVPEGAVTAVWRDTAASGANFGLGCSSNGTVAACSLGLSGAAGPYLKVYDGDGRVLWSSGLLNRTAATSAPLVDATGGVIAADNKYLFRFSAQGQLIWRTPAPGGSPLSPTLLDSGVVILATSQGAVSAYSSVDGSLIGALSLTAVIEGRPGRFATANTPAAWGTRVYVTTAFTPDDGGATVGAYGRLFAVDVDGQGLHEAWHHDFGASSGASPLRIDDTIYFDGERVTPDGPVDPHFFAVRDVGHAGELRWAHRLPSKAVASAAQDPRGGLWVYGRDTTHLLRLSAEDGSVLQDLDLVSLVPSSAMSIVRRDTGQPAMIVSASQSGQSNVVALDLVAQQTLWVHPLTGGAAELPAGQYPIVRAPSGRQTVVFATFARGTVGLAVP